MNSIGHGHPLTLSPQTLQSGPCWGRVLRAVNGEVGGGMGGKGVERCVKMGGRDKVG